jgi:FkbM family methyltransferase
MYSEQYNKMGILDASIYDLIGHTNNDYLLKCIYELKKCDRFSVFGGGDRSITLARYLNNKYGLTAVNFLINKIYNPQVGRMVSIDTDISIPIEEYESYVESNEDVVIVLGIPRAIVPQSILNNEKLKIIAFNFSTCVDENNFLSPQYVDIHHVELEQVIRLLADRYSQECFVKCIASRISGENIDIKPAPWGDPPYLLEDLMIWNETELFIDGGAYVGDFIDEIYSKMPADIVKELRIYSFEPEMSNFKIMYEKWKDDEHVIMLNKGISAEAGTMYFETDLAENGHVSENGDIKLEVDSIDNVLGSKKATFIKFDIEGSELDGLKGAKNQIIDNKPRLAICLYHKQDDLFEIPLYIYKLRSDYKFYVRPHSSMPTELVLYCI